MQFFQHTAVDGKCSTLVGDLLLGCQSCCEGKVGKKEAKEGEEEDDGVNEGDGNRNGTSVRAKVK